MKKLKSRRDTMYDTLRVLDPKAARGKSKARIGVLAELILRARVNTERRTKRFTSVFKKKLAAKDRPREEECGKLAPTVPAGEAHWMPCSLTPGHPGACYHRHSSEVGQFLQTPVGLPFRRTFVARGYEVCATCKRTMGMGSCSAAVEAFDGSIHHAACYPLRYTGEAAVDSAPRRSGVLTPAESALLDRAGVDERLRTYLVSDQADALAAPALFIVAHALLDAAVAESERWTARVKLLDARARRAVDALEGRS